MRLKKFEGEKIQKIKKFGVIELSNFNGCKVSCVTEKEFC